VDRKQIEQKIDELLSKLAAGAKGFDVHVQLTDFLREESVLGLTGQTSLYYPNGSSLSYTDLATWFMQRARKVGSVKVVDDLLHFQERKEIEVSKFYLFHGFTSNDVIRLSDYSKLIPSTELMNELNADLIPSEYINHVHKDRTVLVSHYTLPAIIEDFTKDKGKNVHQSVAEEQGKRYPLEVLKSFNLIVMHALTLIKKIAPAQVFSASIVSPSVPGPRGFHEGSYSEGKSYRNSHSLEDDDVTELKRLINLFLQLEDKKLQKLYVPLWRLLTAKGGGNVQSDSLQRYVDLGIVAESLLLESGKNDEITYKICTRSARLLGKTYEERDYIYNVFYALYFLRSLVVHTGTNQLKKEDRKILNFLEENGPDPHTKVRVCDIAIDYLVEIAKITLEQFSQGEEIKWKKVILQ
jgi:hypothetical protein